jgi:RimJ/RimL family protein N-acetyltransferase
VEQVRDVRLRDGREVQIRPTRTSDAGAMQELFYRLSEEDVRTRFFQKLTSLTDTAAQHLCSVDYEEEMAFAAVVGPPTNERVVAASSYFLNPATGLADVAYLVDPEWQGAGLATIMHAGLVDYAREHGARGLTADVLVGNAAMLQVFRRGDHSFETETDVDVTEVTMRF